MKYSELGNLIKIQKGKKLEEVPNIKKSAIRYIQIGDLRTDENLKYTLNEGNAVLCNSQDILIAWDGANAGTVSFGLEGAIGSTLAKLTLSKEYYPPFVGRFLQSKFEYLQSTCTGATIPHISKAALLKILIPKISIAEQKRIADLLDKADALRKKNQELLAAYDELLKATFLELFGDPVTNPKGWKLCSLSDYGDFKNGMNYSKEDAGYQYQCLGVGDFKHKSILSEFDSISKINLSSIPKEDYFLQDGDLVFVRSNGNRELVGRCLVVYPNNKKITYSGFCIRFRSKTEEVNTVFLSHLFRVPSFRSAMLQNGRGANIQNINQEILSELKTPIPPKKEQFRFFQIVENIELQKTLVKQSLQESEDLFNALVQKAFNGELA